MADRSIGTAETSSSAHRFGCSSSSASMTSPRPRSVDSAFEPTEATGTTVLVDFSETSFIDSTVAGALVKRARNGETLLLVVPSTGGSKNARSHGCHWRPQVV